MDLNELKQSWQNAGSQQGVSINQLDQMTQISQHPVLGRIRRKLLVESAAMVVLLFVFYDFFDGATKPAYDSVILVLGVCFYLASNLYSYFTLKHVVSDGDIMSSLHAFLGHLKQAKAFSLTSLVFFSVSLFMFFSAASTMEGKFILVIAGMMGTTLIFLYLSSRLWARWIGKIKQSISELN